MRHISFKVDLTLPRTTSRAKLGRLLPGATVLWRVERRQAILVTRLPRPWVWYLVGLAAMVALVHRPLLGSFFLEDDARNLYVGSQVESWWGVLYDREVGVEVNNYFYRPLNHFSMWLGWRLFGLNPLWYHLYALALLAATCLLLGWLLHRISQDPLWAWLAGGLLILSPPATVTTAWLSAVHGDLLGGFLYLGSLLSFVRYRQGGSRGWYLTSLTLAAASLLFKEAMASLPLVLLGLDRVIGGAQRLRDRLPPLLPFFGLLAVYLALRTYMLDGLGGYPYVPITASSYLDRLWRLPLLLGSQISVVFPVATSAASIAGVVLLAYLLVRSPGRFLFHAVVFLLMLAPALHLLGSPVSGLRYLFMPWLAVAVALADAMRAMLRSPSVSTRIGAVAVGVLIAISCFASSWRLAQEHVARSEKARRVTETAWRTLQSSPPATKLFFVYDGPPWALASTLLLMRSGAPPRPFAVLRPAPYLASWGLAQRLSSGEVVRVFFYDEPAGQWQDRSNQALEEIRIHLASRHGPSPVLTVQADGHRLSLRWEGSPKPKPVHLYVGKGEDRGIYSEEVPGYPGGGISSLVSAGQYDVAVAYQEDSGAESRMAVASVRIDTGRAGGRPLVPDHFM